MGTLLETYNFSISSNKKVFFFYLFISFLNQIPKYTLFSKSNKLLALFLLSPIFYLLSLSTQLKTPKPKANHFIQHSLQISKQEKSWPFTRLHELFIPSISTVPGSPCDGNSGKARARKFKNL